VAPLCTGWLPRLLASARRKPPGQCPNILVLRLSWSQFCGASESEDTQESIIQATMHAQSGAGGRRHTPRHDMKEGRTGLTARHDDASATRAHEGGNKHGGDGEHARAALGYQNTCNNVWLATGGTGEEGKTQQQE